jgi:hypothetical protein
LQRPAETGATERGSQLGLEFGERQVGLLGDCRSNSVRFGDPFRRASSLGRRAKLALLAPLLLDASHPRLADVEFQRDLLRSQIGIAGCEHLAAKFLRINHRPPPVTAQSTQPPPLALDYRETRSSPASPVWVATRDSNSADGTRSVPAT